jgi:hypothetical protein
VIKLNPQQRNKLLMRVFPALLILVVYFVFIGPKFTAQAERAEREVQQMKDAYQLGQVKISNLTQQKDQLLAELATLRQSSAKPEAEANRQPGFLEQSDYASQAISRLNESLANHRLRVIEDGRQAWSAAKDSLPVTVNELGKPSQPSLQDKGGDGGSALWRVRFSGTYPDVYRALEDLARDDLSIIPVSLEMVAPDGDGDMEWILQIWI